MSRGLNTKEVFDILMSEKQMYDRFDQNLTQEKKRVSENIDLFLKEVIELGDAIKRDLQRKLDLCFEEYKKEFSIFKNDINNYIEQAKQIMANEQQKHTQFVYEIGSTYHGQDPLEDEIKIFNLKNSQAKSIEETFCRIKQIRTEFCLDRSSSRLELGVENSGSIMDFNLLKNSLYDLKADISMKVTEVFGNFVTGNERFDAGHKMDNRPIEGIAMQRSDSDNIWENVDRGQANFIGSDKSIPKMSESIAVGIANLGPREVPSSRNKEVRFYNAAGQLTQVA